MIGCNDIQEWSDGFSFCSTKISRLSIYLYQVTVEPNNGEQHPSQLATVAKQKMRATVEGMQPKLLMAALRGDAATLTYFLNEAADVPPEEAVDSQEGVPLLYLGGDHSLAQTNGAPANAAEEAIRQAAPFAENNSAMQFNEVPVDAGAEGIDILRRVTFDEDTVLHVVATSGDSQEFLESANVIYGKANNLLHAQNSKGDTPLHCAARAGKFGMVSHLISLADVDQPEGERVKELLRVENNLKETALHQAVRIGNKDIVSQLMSKDSELARFPEDGTSPLYLAISLEHDDIAESLRSMSGGNLSYSGPNGQNALHAAVLRGKVVTEMLLTWNEDLAEQVDQNGSTPLHFAALWIRPPYWIFRPLRVKQPNPLEPVLQANPHQLYKPDYEGLFPIHVAASSSVNLAVMTLVNKYPEVAGLRDYEGRTFLHVAVQKGRWKAVEYACRTPSLVWILNMQDNNGNTALHLAVQGGFSITFRILLSNEGVSLNLANNKGETPLDLAESKIPAGFFHAWSYGNLEYQVLTFCHARHGHLRPDHFEEKYIPRLKPEDIVKESNKLTDSTLILGIGSVLIATVTFGSTFALPGGYKADDHKNGGTPTLAGRYIFDAFMMANTIAFVCSSLATFNLMYSGMAMNEYTTRTWHFNMSVLCMVNSLVSLVAAFALGVYLVLAPVAHMTAIALCMLVSVLSFFAHTDAIKVIPVGAALRRRMGNRTLPQFAGIIMFNTLLVYWPLLLTFVWAAISKKYGHKSSVA